MSASSQKVAYQGHRVKKGAPTHACQHVERGFALLPSAPGTNGRVLDAALDLLRRHFLCRTDRAALLAPWASPAPIDVNGHLDALLRGHLLGRRAPALTIPYPGRRGIQHIEGPFRVGTYSPAPDGSTRWACLDFDGGDHEGALEDPTGTALEVYRTFESAGLPGYLERSGGGQGWHIWLFFDPPVPAVRARALAIAVTPPYILNRIELFPKQDTIPPDACGNMLWLPWWFEAEGGANEFHRLDADGDLVPFMPDGFLTVTTTRLDELIRGLPDRPRERTRARAPRPTKQTSRAAEPGELEVWRDMLPDLRWNGHAGRASCPFHPDGDPSLTVGRGHDGLLHWKCHAGCEATALDHPPDPESDHSGDLADLERLWRLHTPAGQASDAELLQRVQEWIAVSLTGNARTVAMAVVDEATRRRCDLTKRLGGFPYRLLATRSGVEQLHDEAREGRLSREGQLSHRGRRIRKALGDLEQAGWGVERGTSDALGVKGRATALLLPAELRTRLRRLP